MIKILYDHQAFEFEQYGGVSRYFSEVIKRLGNNATYDISIKHSNNEYLLRNNLANDVDHLFKPKIRGDAANKNFITRKFENKLKNRELDKKYKVNQQLSIRYICEGKFDIFHPTFYNEYFLPHLKNKPYVLTVHDMTHELFPEYFLSNLVLIQKKEKVIKNASHIIAVSENTKKDIIQLLGVDADKISVIHHSSSLIVPNENCSSLPDLPKRYILYVGARNGYKNFMFFVYAMQSILLKNSDLKLVCTGVPFARHEKDFLNSLGLKNHIIHFSVDDNNLFRLYQNAELFVFPSLYEGFGIPILEAFQAKCPVVLSNSSCFPEVAGDAALYFDPKSKQEISTTIQQVLEDKALKTKLSDAGVKILEKYSWEQATQKVLGVYQKVI